MKITVNIDESLLDDVVYLTGAKTKTAAITHALEEVARRARLVRTLRKGLGLTPDELKDMFDPASVDESLRVTVPLRPKMDNNALVRESDESDSV